MLYYYIPQYPWSIILDFLIHKCHPTAKLLKASSQRYLRPQIFTTYYKKLSFGMYIRLPTLTIDIEPSLEKCNIPFLTYLKTTQRRRRRKVKSIKRENIL